MLKEFCTVRLEIRCCWLCPSVCRAKMITPIKPHLEALHHGLKAVFVNEPVALAMWQATGEAALQEHFSGNIQVTADMINLTNSTPFFDTSARAASIFQIGLLQQWLNQASPDDLKAFVEFVSACKSKSSTSAQSSHSKIRCAAR